MSRPADLEAAEHETVPLYDGGDFPVQPTTSTHSIYTMTREEITKGIANRFVHSHAYIALYLVMAALSVTTVVLSMTNGCPTLAFYILELIINGSMILEVSIRFVAFGRQFWKSPYNIMDLVLTAFCVITLLLIFFAGCGSTSKEEELLDTLLLVARNVLQFGRLAAVMRQSGQSIFSRPKPIDLSAARRRGYTLDIDIEDEGENDLGRPLIQDPVLFDAGEEAPAPRAPITDMPRAAQAVQDRDTEDVWAEIG
ncbi:hypothetical protein BKA93DRAFT_820252 [Sparassis latifolia]|uniref:Ion transport domain-containing protein n=1 Tax=Sparassis crispa TaxID=139825 RepID=A0A401G6B2_9APHY|nr:hypothetical protein SCP_0105690 [Sparassis crispa]GBE77687.1 hypothetical protein SCP_0105690 [Sparassis crispa]